MVRLAAFSGILLIICTSATSGIDTQSWFPSFSLISNRALNAFSQIKCRFYECCHGSWLPMNVTGMRNDLRDEVHGQHLVVDSVVHAIEAHVNLKNPVKALVLSFHGLTGTGKNFVSNIIAKNLYKKGFSSKFVHPFIASHHFAQEELLPFYRHQIKDWIHSNVSACARNLFIFDEMDKMPGHLIDTIKPYIDFYEKVDGIDFRKSIFIFLSNTASYDITYQTLQHYYNGKKRGDLNIMQLQEVINTASFNEKGGLWHSSLIEHHLIDLFVPFLPLERGHVRKCIEDKLRNSTYSHRLTRQQREELIVNALSVLPYFPKRDQIYVESGCKRVGHIISMLLYNEMNKMNKEEL